MGAAALINKDREAGCVIGPGTMLAAPGLAPERGIDDRKHGVAFGPQMDMRDGWAIRMGAPMGAKS
jgi:hypothetical protein